MNGTNPSANQPQPRVAKKKAWVVGLVVVVVLTVLGLAGFAFLSGGPKEAPATAEGNVVTYSSGGFQPGNILIKVGETVVWKNVSPEGVTVESNPHPLHTSYPPLNIGAIAPNGEKSLMFPTAGTYNYHNHLNPLKRGTVTVQ